VRDFENFFNQATGLPNPYPYQKRLAEDEWPEVLDIPTGLGKTAAVTLAWAWRRWEKEDGSIPRRLVWCLPMRVLGEQTHRNIREWLAALDLLGEPGDGKISTHLLMGGEPSLRTATWASYPEEESILIGTQDMLLSRALMRGYGMSRYQWPVHFGLLHNDALWVYDEIQLMGAALPTSTQLEAFRRGMETNRPCRSLWASATLHRDWLDTVDFRPHLDQLSFLTLNNDDEKHEQVSRRLSANKALQAAETRLTEENRKGGAKTYIADLAQEILAAHQTGSQTLVILNRVERAQALHAALSKQMDTSPLLLHARFRPRERAGIEAALRSEIPAEGRIIIATQAVEAGVDISSRVMFTELAPWSSLVQRFGRCNRSGEHRNAAIYWIDIEDDSKEALPYEMEDLSAARTQLSQLESASPGDLPAVDATSSVRRVIRRRDLVDLFNTDPDLSGFDVDISAYIRDPGQAQSQVFWRDFEDKPGEQPAPSRDELCPVGLGQLKDYLAKRQAWVWDPLSEQWERIDRHRVRPGQQLMLQSQAGGYTATGGFNAADKKSFVEPIEVDTAIPAESQGSDEMVGMNRYVPLSEHLQDVDQAGEQLAQQLEQNKDLADIIKTAGLWHDVGKAHEAFQNGITQNDAPGGGGPWAKSPHRGRPNYHILNGDGAKQPRRGFRHELASALVWLEHENDHPQRDLIAYLIAAHHGKVRLGLRALPNETAPEDEQRLFARGVWEGDRLPPVRLNGKEIPETELKLDLMKLGHGPQGPSWTERTRQLLDEHGPFRLAWLEALVRIADWRASRKEEQSS
jgi:CRISPR-associated endonuclease/helicase Cas3